jgi:3-oxoadipate enol-lactonase
MGRWFAPGFRASAPETIADIATALEATPVSGYAACCAAIRDADFRADVSSISLPTLVISGSEDPVTPPQDGIFLTESIAGAQYVELSAAHLCNVELANDFNSALVRFLVA